MCFRHSAKTMPEMPEIETLARQLRKKIVGKRIADVRLSGMPLRRPIDGAFAAKIRNRVIRKILRRGKYLVFELEPKAFCLLHLGMSGRVLCHTSTGNHTKHTHAIFRFADDTELEYRDPRRFGLLALYEGMKLGRIPEICLLGKDPLSLSFNGKWLGSLLRDSRQEIKSFLFNQRKVAGLGNIYICESLFHAGIHPARRCYSITFRETARLVEAIRKVMKGAIKRHGTSFSDFMDSDGNFGENQKHLMVFQREGEECLRCREPIRRMWQGNRSSFYCPCCQH
jgi:formamidopyrimidine-DNA glycosylase